MVIANILKKIPQKCRTILEFLNFRVLWQWPTWVSEIGNQSDDKNQWYLVGHVILLNICLLNCFIHRNWPDWSLQSYRSADQIPNYYNEWMNERFIITPISAKIEFLNSRWKKFLNCDRSTVRVRLHIIFMRVRWEKSWLMHLETFFERDVGETPTICLLLFWYPVLTSAQLHWRQQKYRPVLHIMPTHSHVFS